MIYADFNGSAPLCPRVKEFLISRISEDNFANPNASHRIGNRLMRRIEKTRKKVAEVIGCEPQQVIFNSGASEGISHIFHSILDNTKERGNKVIVTSELEHAAVNQAAQYWASKGFKHELIKVDESGEVSLKHFEELLELHQNNIVLVSMMAANNETGVIQPYKEMGKLCQSKEIPFFSDTTQYIGKTSFSFQDSFMDFAVTSSHKVAGLIGTGVLVAKDPSKLTSFIHGGGQESKLRGGTQNYLAIEALYVALESFQMTLQNMEQLSNERKDFENQLIKNFPKAVIMGDQSLRLPGTTLVAIPPHSGQKIQEHLEDHDILVTTSSACSDAKDTMSHVLKSMGVEDNIGRSVVRISLCCHDSKKSYQKILDCLSQL